MTNSTPYIDVVFDGPPEAESGRFVEVEGPDGASIKAGEWIDPEGLETFWRLRLRPSDLATDRALVAAALEQRVAELAAAVGAGIRGMAIGMPEHIVGHIAELSVSLIAAAFGSDIGDDEIRGALREHNDDITKHIAAEFQTIAPEATVTDWVIGVNLVRGEETGFSMLVSRNLGFMHQAIAHELVSRIAAARRTGE